MSFIMDENIVGVWYLQVSQDIDALFNLRLNEEGEYNLGARTRVYVDDKFSNSEDKKTWHTATLKPGTSRKEALRVAKDMVMSTKKTFKVDDDEFWELINDGDFERFSREFLVLPFVHVSKESVN